MTTPNRPYLLHLKDSSQLVTTYEARRAGFVKAALEKGRRSVPHVAAARSLLVKASRAKKAHDLLNMTDIRQGLLTAAGLSDKAIGHLTDQDRAAIIAEFIKNFLDPAGDKFVEELVFRFLLIRGDTLGGTMRNVTGALAQRDFTQAVVSNLQLAGRAYAWLDKHSGQWTKTPAPQDLDRIKALAWKRSGADRVLRYNISVPLLKKNANRSGNNVDLCLFACAPAALATRAQEQATYSSPKAYVALGELKGGIDPAGADEHWKTANSALGRIREAFKKHNASPCLFFVGAAIEQNMANEIWSQLQSNDLSNAANLTDHNQLASLVTWLCEL